MASASKGVEKGVEEEDIYADVEDEFHEAEDEGYASADDEGEAEEKGGGKKSGDVDVDQLVRDALREANEIEERVEKAGKRRGGDEGEEEGEEGVNEEKLDSAFDDTFKELQDRFEVVGKKLVTSLSAEAKGTVSHLRLQFAECAKTVSKPNILVAGITGAGKSALVNAVFGQDIAQEGAGLPVTQHFQKFENSTTPVVIFDSKGLEWGSHEEFLRETGEFFQNMQAKEDLADRIHVVWYVVNTARGRFEGFEEELCKRVFGSAGVPVLFLLNKADNATAQQVHDVSKAIASTEIVEPNHIFPTVARRENWSQSWCPLCMGVDFCYDELAQTIECEAPSCDGKAISVHETYNVDLLVRTTCDLLPEFAKDVFMFAQASSVTEKDRRALEIVREYAKKKVSFDVKGKWVYQVAEMSAKLFVLWGWNSLDASVQDTAELFEEFFKRIAAKYKKAMYAVKAFDLISGWKVSKALAGVCGCSISKMLQFAYEKMMEKASDQVSTNLSHEVVFEVSEDELTKTAAGIEGDALDVPTFAKNLLTKGFDKALDIMWHGQALLSGKEGSTDQQVTKPFAKTLQSIFVAFDNDKDGLLSDAEFRSFYHAINGSDPSEEYNEFKERYDHSIVPMSEGAQGLTLDGFVEMWRDQALANREKVWYQLRRIGIGRSLGAISVSDVDPALG